MAVTRWWKELTDYDTTRVKIRVLGSTWRNLSYVDLHIWCTMCLCYLKENLWQSGNIPQCSVLWRGRGILVTHRNKYCNHVLTKFFVVERLKRQYYPFVGITKSATYVASFTSVLSSWQGSSKRSNQQRNTLRVDNEAVS